MKKLLSLLLSFTLIISPLSVQAEERAMDAYTKDDASGSGTGSQKGKEFYMLQAGMLAMAAVGANMLTCVPSSYHFSHYVFIGGGAAIIGGEIANIGEKNDYHKRKKESLEIKDANLVRPQGIDMEDKRDLQMAALKAAKAEEENNKEMMEKRNKWIKIAVVLYDAAAIAAAAEMVLSWFPVYTGFVPDVLSCGALVNPMIMSGLSLAYGIKSGMEESNGKLGLDTVGFIALLHLEFSIAAGIATPLVTTSYGRIAYFGGAALIANEVKDGIEDRIQIATTNIAKLDAAILAWELASAPSGGVVQGTTASTNTNQTTTSLTESNYLSQSAPSIKPVQGKCFASSGAGVDHSSSACKNPIKFKPFSSKFVLPELVKTNNQALKVSDALARGDMLEAEIQGDALLANAGRMKEIREEIYKDINKKLKEKGEKPMDLKAVIQAKRNEMVQDMKNGANKNGFGLGGTATIADDSSKDKATSSDSPMSAAAKPAVVMPATGAPKFDLATGSEAATEVSDASGMSDEEKDRMSANYDRTKGEYKTNEDDTLFRVLSKTYIRNLDKILTRKKKLDEGAASFPSEPSKQ